MRDTSQRRSNFVSVTDARQVQVRGANIRLSAFDHALRIAQTQSYADLELAMRPAAESLGFFDFMLLERAGAATRVVVGSPANPYFSEALKGPEKEVQHTDVIYRVALSTTDAFFYSEVVASHPLTAADREGMARRAAHGIREGFVGVRHRQGGVETCVVMVAVDIAVHDPDVRAATRLLSDYYGAAARRLLAAARKPALGPHLTQRQRDCLYWVGHGKSGADIAEILGISPHTVHAHVSDACARLGVRTRVQAVATALALGFIES